MEVLFENLELMPYPAPWGGGRWSYNSNPFTGIANEYYDNTQILSSKTQFVDGYIEGLQTEYYFNGNKKTEYYKKDDFIYNYLKKWNEQGDLIYYVQYDNFGNFLTKIV